MAIQLFDLQALWVVSFLLQASQSDITPPSLPPTAQHQSPLLSLHLFF
jgi:hypothetical protein